MIDPKNPFNISPENPPTLTSAIEHAFLEGAQKIIYTKIMTQTADDRVAISVKLDTIMTLGQEITGIANSIDIDDPRQVTAAMCMKEGIFSIVLSKEDFEIIKDFGFFQDVDENLKNTYLNSLKQKPE